MYKDYKSITYVEGLGDKNDGYLAPAMVYQPIVIAGNAASGMNVVGVCGVGDCIGIVAQDPHSKTIIAHHINDLFNGQIVALGLLSFVIKTGLVPTEKLYEMKKLYNDSSEDVKLILSTINDVKILQQIPFYLITSTVIEDKMSGLLDMLMAAGVSKENIFIDTKTDRIIIDRKNGNVCTNFNIDKTLLPEEYYDQFKTKEELEQAQKERDAIRMSEAKKLLFMMLSKKEKFSEITRRGFIQHQDTTLRFMLTKEMNDIAFKYRDTIWGDVLEYSKELMIDTIEFHFPSFTPSNLYYQEIPTYVIKNLKEKGPHIKTLQMTFLTKEKRAYVSMLSDYAAVALKENGIFLRTIQLKANTRAAQIFISSAEYLMKEGALLNFEISPIAETWALKTLTDSVTTIQSFLENKKMATQNTTNTSFNTNNLSAYQQELLTEKGHVHNNNASSSTDNQSYSLQ